MAWAIGSGVSERGFAHRGSLRWLAQNGCFRHGSILGNTLLTGKKRLSGRNALVLTSLRRAQAQVFTGESVTLAPDNLNHA